ncbi:hypothetical protein WISP_70460 [Willisornis vidua]|uniref:Uncharacterized protein n=1 Tax=Willisornis vidua TaxID=1566151 RepID=A0ABQ9D7P1_9PASS|nr:hypothetical protein WISP_70460 [Willisornis vidua]
MKGVDKEKQRGNGQQQKRLEEEQELESLEQKVGRGVEGGCRWAGQLGRCCATQNHWARMEAEQEPVHLEQEEELAGLRDTQEQPLGWQAERVSGPGTNQVGDAWEGGWAPIGRSGPAGTLEKGTLMNKVLTAGLLEESDTHKGDMTLKGKF